MRIKILIIILLVYLLPISAIENDKWEIYPSYSNITEIEPTGNNTFVLASGSIFSYNIKENSVITYNKANYLSDFDISHIAWNNKSKKLVIAYSSGNIDLLETNGKVTNIPDLYLKSITDSKSIHHIYINDIYAYISLSFGIIKVNTQNGTIQDTYQLDFSVDYCYIDNNYIYAESSTQGKYRAALKDNLLDKNNWQNIGNYEPFFTNKTNVYDNANKYWWTVKDEKLNYYTINANNEKIFKTEGILPEGPASNHFYRLYLRNGVLYSVAGAWSQEKDCGYTGEIHVKDGNNWWEFEQPSNETIGHRYQDLLAMDFNPKQEGNVMVAAKGGIYEFQDGKYKNHYNMDNSPLTSCIHSKNYILTTDLKYQENGSLWLFNSAVTNNFWTLNQNKEWNKVSISSQIEKFNNDLRSIILSKRNNKLWFINNYWNKTQLYAYDYQNENLISYGPTYTNEDGIAITPNYLYKIAEDKDGNIWLCTTSGPLYLAANDIQNNSSIFTQHKIARNDGTNYADYLLANIATRCIAFDGGNQKWIGTDNGVFVISEDCNTQIAHFTTENSPLISNTIHDIIINQNTGIVYFATDKGLCSYSSDITTPSSEMSKDNVYAYPNPVKPDYTGDITIVGLSLDADIKIVSSNGGLINQGRSLGGTYKWNGCNLKGRKVASGIYMVETATSQGQKGIVCKIAIIN